jgi:hypothetical protein
MPWFDHEERVRRASWRVRPMRRRAPEGPISGTTARSGSRRDRRSRRPVQVGFLQLTFGQATVAPCLPADDDDDGTGESQRHGRRQRRSRRRQQLGLLTGGYRGCCAPFRPSSCCTNGSDLREPPRFDLGQECVFKPVRCGHDAAATEIETRHTWRIVSTHGSIRCRERLGGTLRFYYREAA